MKVVALSNSSAINYSNAGVPERDVNTGDIEAEELPEGESVCGGSKKSE